MVTAEAAVHPFEFHIWERLRIMVGDEGEEGIYSCRISDILGNGLLISRPHFERGDSLLADGRRVNVFVTRADAAYVFGARIVETDPKSPDAMYLRHPSKVKRLQRRRFVRLEKVMRVQYRVLARPLREMIDLGTADLVESVSVNLSAGGIMISAPAEMAVDNLLLLTTHESGLGSLPAYILAVCRHITITDRKLRTAGVEFILREDLPRYLKSDEMQLIPEAAREFDDRMQNHLVSELFAEQLVMRQKGLL